MDLISIIVPVYNMSEFLSGCIDSILSQTYRNLEIIVVDDGSTDNCFHLCEQYQLKDKRIRLIHQENKGLSAARNKGYRISNGKYIAFVDSDDMISDCYVESLYRLITENNAQIAVCAYTRTLKELETKGTVRDCNYHTLTSEQMLREWHGKRKAIETVVWNKLYDRRVFEPFQDGKIFPEGRVHEDIYTSHVFVSHAKIVNVTMQKLYYYRIREDSISRNFTKAAAEADLDAQRVRMRFFGENKFYEAYLRLLAGHLLHKGMYAWKKFINHWRRKRCLWFFC